MTDQAQEDGRVPTATELEALDADAWAALLPHARAALHDLEESELDHRLELLRASPTSRLVGGRMRAELAAAIAAGGSLWRHLHRHLADAAPAGLGWLVRGEQPPERVHAAGEEDGDDDSGGRSSGGGVASEERRRLRRRAKELRRELETSRTRAEGLAARVATLEDKLAQARSEVADEREAAAELRSRIGELEDELSAAVERERRRNESELEDLREELRGRRREVHRLRDELQRRDEARARRGEEEDDDGSSGADAGPARTSAPGPAMAVAGRPSELPAGVERGTAEAVLALLTPGRTLLVDGYNLTITQRGHLDLEEQRRWLVTLLGRVAARFDVEAQVVFDGSRGIRGPVPSVPGVTSWFSPEDVEADDEIDLAVAAMDPDAPVLVVTDDGELRERVAAHGADVVGTGPFVWAVG